MAAWYRYRCRPESASPEWWAAPAAACRYRYGPEHSHVPDFPASSNQGAIDIVSGGKFITLRLLVPLHVRHADVFIRRTFTRMNTIHLRLAVNVSSPENAPGWWRYCLLVLSAAVLPHTRTHHVQHTSTALTRRGNIQSRCQRTDVRAAGCTEYATERPFSPYLSRQHTTREQ